MGQFDQHWVGPRHCQENGRCFHHERVEKLLTAAEQPHRTEAAREYYLNKAMKEESFTEQCPVFSTNQEEVEKAAAFWRLWNGS